MLLSLTLIGTGHQFNSFNVPSDRLRTFNYIDNCFSRSSPDQILKFVSQCPKLLECVISTTNGAAVSHRVQQIPDLLSKLRSLHAPLSVFEAVIPRTSAITRLSVDMAAGLARTWFDSGIEQLISDSMLERLEVLLLSNINPSPEFLRSLAANGKHLMYLEFCLDTSNKLWRGLLDIILRLNLRGVGIGLLGDNDWCAEPYYINLMEEKADLVEYLVERTEVVKAWISVLHRTRAWSRETVDDVWVEEEFLPMWFWYRA
ncbi:hypothetical protein FRC02_010868 [Tulasnella sp. 418]|nr:hypothetical protein FRC02_010868 [Tulasnella sp. 418]